MPGPEFFVRSFSFAVNVFSDFRGMTMKNARRLVRVLCFVAMELPLTCLGAADTTPPFMVSVGSLNGEGVGVCFSVPVDPVTVTNRADYAVWNLNPTNADVSKTDSAVSGVTLRPAGRSIQISLSELLNFRLVRVWATNIQDLAGNVMTNAYVPGPVGFNDGDLVHLLTADLPQPGTNPCETGSVSTCWTIVDEMTNGGSGLGSANDGFEFRLREGTGDFDLQEQWRRPGGAPFWKEQSENTVA